MPIALVSFIRNKVIIRNIVRAIAIGLGRSGLRKMVLGLRSRRSTGDMGAIRVDFQEIEAVKKTVEKWRKEKVDLATGKMPVHKAV